MSAVVTMGQIPVRFTRPDFFRSKEERLRWRKLNRLDEDLELTDDEAILLRLHDLGLDDLKE